MENQNELMHYGVLGMKWGVRRSLRKSRKNYRLERRAARKDIRSARMAVKAEKRHRDYDLEASNRAGVKAARLKRRSTRVARRALKTKDEYKRIRREKRAAKLAYKSAKKKRRGDRIALTTGYGIKAMRYSIKSNRAAKAAARARYRIAKNKAYIAMTERKISKLSPEDMKKGEAYIRRFNAIRG